MFHLREKREGPEHPYGVVERSYANFRELRHHEVRRIHIPRTSVNRTPLGVLRGVGSHYGGQGARPKSKVSPLTFKRLSLPMTTHGLH